MRIYAAYSLREVTHHLLKLKSLPAIKPSHDGTRMHSVPDLVDVIGQFRAKRALEIAASGGHNLLLIGPPGTGKTMLATRLPGLLGEMSETDALASAAIHSVSGVPVDPSAWRQRPFRAPHHSSSAAALVGGGRIPRPGEISLAHNGVLFLDEFPEFNRRALEALREPLESGVGRSHPVDAYDLLSREISIDRGDESVPLWLCRRCTDRLPVYAR